MAGWARTRARERIDEICASLVDATALRRGVLDAMRGVVEFDAFVWLLTDPVTTVGVAPFAQVPCLPELPRLIKAKYGTGLNRWTTLMGAGSPVGLLRDTVGGALIRSRVWREVMSRHAVGDVASTVFADRFGCWGFLDLWRDDRGERSPALTRSSSLRWRPRWRQPCGCVSHGLSLRSRRRTGRITAPSC